MNEPTSSAPFLVQNYLKQFRLSGKPRFFKPRNNEEIFSQLEVDNGVSPAAANLFVKDLHLIANDVIPFHRHEWREKYYLHMGGGSVQVLVESRPTDIARSVNGCAAYPLLKPGDNLIIPPGRWHAVICTKLEVSTGFARIHIVGTATTPEDIVWQQDIEELIGSKA
jgi:hypothetical protein